MSAPTKVLRELLDELSALHALEEAGRNARPDAPANTPTPQHTGAAHVQALTDTRVEAGRLIDELACWLDAGGRAPHVIRRDLARTVGLCTYTVDDASMIAPGKRPRAAAIPADFG